MGTPLFFLRKFLGSCALVEPPDALQLRSFHFVKVCLPAAEGHGSGLPSDFVGILGGPYDSWLSLGGLKQAPGGSEEVGGPLNRPPPTCSDP